MPLISKINRSFLDRYDEVFHKPFQFIAEIFLDRLDDIFPPEGVNVLDETLNESHDEFRSEQGIAYRKHWLTRLSSFLGLPNRKLSIFAGQSWQNLWDNFKGKQEIASPKKNLRRAAIMIPLNILLTLFKLPLNILKIATEYIPACLVHLSFLPCVVLTKILNDLPLPTPIRVVPFAILVSITATISCALIVQYFIGCCLTSAYETMKSALYYEEMITGGLVNKIRQPMKVLLVGIVIVTTVMVFLVVLPLAAKILMANVAPFIAHHLPTVILNGLDKFAHFMQPAMTAIGRVSTKIAEIFFCTPGSIYVIPLIHVLSTVPALVGASLFVAVAISTIGPLISSYIDDFKAWWNRDPNFITPPPGEAESSNILHQQTQMLCALAASLESETEVIDSELITYEAQSERPIFNSKADDDNRVEAATPTLATSSSIFKPPVNHRGQGGAEIPVANRVIFSTKRPRAL